MTLTEYLNQTAPKRQFGVMLELSEVQIWRVHKGFNVHIPALKERFGVQPTYFVQPDSSCLFTTDQDGNKKRISCFELNFDPQLLTWDGSTLKYQHLQYQYERTAIDGIKRYDKRKTKAATLPN